MSKCEEVRKQLQRYLMDSVITQPSKDNGCMIQTPFHDSEGDPIRVVAYREGEKVLLSDGCMVAGRLFILGQHTQDTPAFKLLRSLETAYDLKLDFNYGRITMTTSEHDMCDAIMDFSKVIITMLTATPHIRVEPHRLKPLGQRVKAKIKDQYKQANILDLVEHDFTISGEIVESWHVDFHWWLRRNGEMEHIYIVTVDLDVVEALVKASKVTTLALDAKRFTSDKLRIVLDTHGTNSDASIATSLVKKYSEKLQYMVYDFGQEDDRQIFIKQSVDEILGDVGEPWRDFWQKQRTLT